METGRSRTRAARSPFSLLETTVKDASGQKGEDGVKKSVKGLSYFRLVDYSSTSIFIGVLYRFAIRSAGSLFEDFWRLESLSVFSYRPFGSARSFEDSERRFAPYIIPVLGPSDAYLSVPIIIPSPLTTDSNDNQHIQVI